MDHRQAIADPAEMGMDMKHQVATLICQVITCISLIGIILTVKINIGTYEESIKTVEKERQKNYNS